MLKGVIAMEGARPRHDAGWAPEVAALAPVANRPLLLHAVDTLRRAGAEAVLVAGDEAALHAAAPVLDAEAPDVERLEVASGGSAADAVLAAADWLQGDRVAVHLAEGMLLRDGGSLRRALADDESDATVFFATSPGAAEPADSRRVTGIHVFSGAVADVLEQLPPEPGGRRSLLDAVDRVAAAGGTVRAGVLEGWWSWDATAERLLEANRVVLDALEPAMGRPGLVDTRLEGRVRIHPTARVSHAVIRGPVIIGAHAHVTDAYVGPYTTIGDGATIDNSEIESSIVLPRARIRHVGVRVEASIVGAGASVGRDFALPRALRLLIGRDASITLS